MRWRGGTNYHVSNYQAVPRVNPLRRYRFLRSLRFRRNRSNFLLIRRGEALNIPTNITHCINERCATLTYNFVRLVGSPLPVIVSERPRRVTALTFSEEDFTMVFIAWIFLRPGAPQFPIAHPVPVRYGRGNSVRRRAGGGGIPAERHYDEDPFAGFRRIHQIFHSFIPMTALLRLA
jgi:hypothetical protein